MAGPLLEFETEMFLSLFGCDGLLVVAEGMGIDRILLQFMRVYSEQGSLVLLLNTSTAEQVGAAPWLLCHYLLKRGSHSCSQIIPVLILGLARCYITTYDMMPIFQP